MKIHEGMKVITDQMFTPDVWEMERAIRDGLVEIVGPTQFKLMERAKTWTKQREPGSGDRGLADLMVVINRERLAARRLVERGLLRYHFPGAGPRMPQRRFFSLTPRGRECWVLQRWDGQ